MSLISAGQRGIVIGFPRVSGDEPGISSMIGSVKSFSLRERG